MGKYTYTDDEIRSFPKITCKIAADYLGISSMAVSIGMRNDLLPIGYAIHNEDRYSESWSYQIIDDRLIAYKHGKITNVQIQNIEKNLNTIISHFEEMKKDLLFILSESAG
jgi:ribosomal protein S15P/S13E